MQKNKGGTYISADKNSRAGGFLGKIKAVIKTGELEISQRPKNNEFMERYKIKHEKAIAMVSDLEPEDCFAIEPNDNNRFAESEVYKFKREYELENFGNLECVTVYIKMYLVEKKTYDYVMVISFHKDNEIEE